MRDPYLILITSIICAPSKPLKFYLDISKVSRGTFFKVKGHLEAMGIISLNDRKQLVVDREKGLNFLAEAYPRLSAALEAQPQSPNERLNSAPAEDTQNSDMR